MVPRLKKSFRDQKGTRRLFSFRSVRLLNLNSLINKTVSEQFERFLASQEFKNMLVMTTKTVTSTVVQAAVHVTTAKEIQEAVEPLKKQIKDLSDNLEKIGIHANDNEQYSRRCVRGLENKAFNVQACLI